MAKTKQEEEVAVTSKNSGSLTVITHDGEVNLDITSALEELKKLKEGASITSEYLTFEEDSIGETKRLIYIGITRIKKINGEDGETTEAVKFVDGEDGTVKTNADRVLVSICSALHAPKAVAITLVGWKKSGKGKYRDFEVRELTK